MEKNTSIPKIHIGEIIKSTVQQYNQNYGSSQAWLARKIGCSGSNINKIFERRSIDTELLLKISIALGINLFETYNEVIEANLPKRQNNQIKSNQGDIEAS